MPVGESTDGLRSRLVSNHKNKQVTRGNVPENTTGKITAAFQPVYSRLEATLLAVTRTGAKSFANRNALNRAYSAHLGHRHRARALSELRRLTLYCMETLQDIAHETYGADPAGHRT